MKYSKDGVIRFDESKHIYYKGDKIMKGVTSYIKDFKEPFDSDRIATAYALKNGLIKEDVLAMWKAKADESIKMGSLVHKMIEDYILTGTINNTKQYKKEDHGESFINDVFVAGKLIPVETEYIVYNDYLASQIDCIVKNQNGEYFILDFKTSGKIDKESFGQRKMIGKYSDLNDCSFYHYSLQLSIYEELLKEYPVKCSYILHIHDTGYSFIKSEKINPLL